MKLDKLDRLLKGSVAERLFHQFVVSFVSGHYRTPELNHTTYAAFWSKDTVIRNESSTLVLRRAKIFELSCRYGHNKCLEDADYLFRELHEKYYDDVNDSVIVMIIMMIRMKMINKKEIKEKIKL